MPGRGRCCSISFTCHDPLISRTRELKLRGDTNLTLRSQTGWPNWIQPGLFDSKAHVFNHLATLSFWGSVFSLAEKPVPYESQVP